jgi:hypothetical protein|nr:MAG TPA: protein of unknown function (DUF5052) [Caudoviricetes sp.]
MKNKKYRIIGMITKVILSSLFILVLFTGCSSSCQRQLVDMKSDFGNGLERTINVYTADGEIIASYSGKIDIETNDGGYVKFDLDGKRYIYYNCFVETIADID